MRHAWDERPVLYLTMIIRKKPRIATCAQLGLCCVALSRLLKATLHLLGKLIETPDVDPPLKPRDRLLEIPNVDSSLKEALSSAQKLHKEVFREAVEFNRESGGKAEDWAAALSVAGFTMPKAISVGLVVPENAGPAWEEGLPSKPDQTRLSNQVQPHSNNHYPRTAQCQHYHHRCGIHRRYYGITAVTTAADHSAPCSPALSPKPQAAQESSRIPKDQFKYPKVSKHKDILHDLDSSADAKIVEVPAAQRDLVQSLKRAAECAGGDETLAEIAASLTPLLVARNRLTSVMKGYTDSTRTTALPKDKSTPWERCPWKRESASESGETHQYHLLAQGTDVADLAIERFPHNKHADQRIMKLTKPVVRDAFVNGTWRLGSGSRPSSAVQVHSGRRPFLTERPASTPPCPPSMNGRIH